MILSAQQFIDSAELGILDDFDIDDDFDSHSQWDGGIVDDDGYFIGDEPDFLGVEDLDDMNDRPF